MRGEVSCTLQKVMVLKGGLFVQGGDLRTGLCHERIVQAGMICVMAESCDEHGKDLRINTMQAWIRGQEDGENGEKEVKEREVTSNGPSMCPHR